MSILPYLQLQPVEPNDDGTSSSPLDEYKQDETIDLNNDIDEQTLEKAWDAIVHDLGEDGDKLTFSDE